ncbi:UROD/MetE-like protein [Laetiporus sulphureus 93-53]|uniref:UROD/MetE-like protein n=1 Tax=Laetiporus sulphureus 93-53 TaxID=1314785 RepID=A0A165FJZ0_9APHY|nr:UROD/MetE-like protein [Laetiporus sulphureus 93-53]KZT09085.1 UROD/MetE-like protein [Laetiporus sulphureus 93-53]
MFTASPRLNPPFRADHIGSLKRPVALLQKRKELDEGKCTQEELRVVEDEAIRSIIKMQGDVGIKAITDGEFRRHMFYDGVFDNLEGMKYIPVVPIEWFMDYVPDVDAFKQHSFKAAASYLCESKLKRIKPFYVDQYEALKQLTKLEEHGHIKITMCAPEWFHLRHGPYAYPKSVYKNDEEYFADIIQAYREEIKDLYAAGCRNIQFDDPLLAFFCDVKMLKGMEEQGVDHEALLNLYCRVYQDLLRGRPADMTVGIHLCRGNFKDGRHFSEGGYDRIAIKLFQEIPADTYYLEYETERAGTFEPLRWLPRNKSVVLGIVSSKFPKMEDKEGLIKRVHEAAEVIANGDQKRSKEEALNQICISPQCGFASHAEGNLVTEEHVVRKLQLVVDTAKAIWPDA